MNAINKPSLSSFSRSLPALVVMAAMLTLGVGLLRGQSFDESDTQAYPLEYARLDDVERQLRSIIADAPGKAEIVVDRPRGRILVTGSPEAHRLASQLIAAMDRPNPAPSAAGPGEKPVLEGYAVDPSQTEARAAALRKVYPPTSGVRIATDARTGQILVLAPPAVQREIFRQLRQASADQAPKPTTNQATKPASELFGPRSRHVLHLAHITWRELETRLGRLKGRELSVTTHEGGKLATITFPSVAGGQVQMQVDRLAGRVMIEGPDRPARGWAQVVRALDTPPTTNSHETQVVPLRYAKESKVQRALAVFQTGDGAAAGGDFRMFLPTSQAAAVRWGGDMVSMIFQGPDDGAPPKAADNKTAGDAATTSPPAAADNGTGTVPDGPPADAGAAAGAAPGRLIGPVQIEYVEGLDIIVIRGNKRDVERVAKIIEEIERLSAETEPMIEIYRLHHVDGASMASLVSEVYEQILAPRHGRVNITPLAKPNALLLIGREEGVKAVVDLVKRLDEPVPPSTQLRVFQLRHMPASDAEYAIRTFFDDAMNPEQEGQRGILGTKVRIISDIRSNAIIVQASPRDMAEVVELIGRIDVAKSRSVNELRVFKLRNALAEELAPVLEEAIRGDQQFGPGGPGGAQRPGQTLTTGQAGAQRLAGQQPRSAMLTFTTVDPKGGRLLKSGILNDVRINADARTNSLLVTAPPESMELIASLIEHLDELPTAQAQVKVFTIVNGDATRLVQMLQELFGRQVEPGQPAVQTGAETGESSLVPLTFSSDLRTNSIIATGSSGDLAVVEAILLRLDESDVRQRISVVYRLKHAPATDVAASINEFLDGERQLQQIDPSLVSPFQQIERQAVVVAEPVSNSLIVSALPRYFEEIEKIVEDLDAQPPMVLIQVLIAEVQLGDFDELGAELGLQDSLLFNRSSVVGGLLQPGMNFNNQPLGNDAGAASLATAGKVAGQALTSFAVGRVNGNLGYGGLVLSAGSESVNVLIRALNEDKRLEILSRPQVMTLDNQPAFVQVGSLVPRVSSAQTTTTGTINNVTLDEVGLILGVTPRISPDGLVVMEVDATKSELGPESEGIAVSINPAGDVIRQPQINITTAQTTVSARDGQTVVLGGLITKNKSVIARRVPLLSQVPIAGSLFRFDSYTEKRTELLIILTPHVVDDDEDLEWIRSMESERMSWCLMDVAEVEGELGIGGSGPGAAVVYPDEDPTASEIVPPPVPDGDDLEMPIPPPDDRSSRRPADRPSSVLLNPVERAAYETRPARPPYALRRRQERPVRLPPAN